MSIHNWLHNLRSAFTPGKRTRKTRRRFAQRFMPNGSQVESLEDRRLLTFSPAVNYPADINPLAIVSADFNGDGELDLATANSYSNTVSVLLGDGQGGFSAPGHLSVGSTPRSVAVGDFDSDGNLDLATANSGGNDLSILTGNGDGTFRAPTNVTIAASPTSVAVGDFNGDGKLDLAAVSHYDSYYNYYSTLSYAEVLLGNGEGSFSSPNTTFLGYGYRTSAAVADFNNDGRDDLATTNPDYTSVDVLSIDVFGYFQIAGSFSVGDSPQSVAAGDVDGDGDIDLVTANYWDISVLLADGSGGFGAARNYPIGSPASSVALGDFDSDGTIDVASAHANTSSVSILRGRGDASASFSPAESFPAGPGASAVAAGDFNGDGWLDLATANVSGDGASVSILVNDQSWPPAPNSLAINDMTVTEGDGGTVAAVFTVMRSGDLAGTTTVAYSTVNGGAVAGSDYIAGSGTIVFAPGEATRTITILVIGDLTDEWDQGFYVNLSAASSGAVITDGQGFGTIVDNDPPPTITITSIVSAKEGNNNATKLFNFVVTLSAASEKEVRVNFATANGTATTADGDYVAQSGTLIFAPGTTSRTISIQVKGDKKREPNERFFVNLTDATNATIAAPQGIGEILDDDAPGRKG